MKKGWPVKALAKACQIKPSKSEALKRCSSNDIVSFVPMEDLGVEQKYLIPKKTRHLIDVVGSYTYFSDGDVLLAKITPCFENGKLGIATNLNNGIGFGSSEYIIFRPEPSVDKEWLYYFLSSDSFRVQGAERMTGAVGHKRIPKEFIETYPIPVPSLPEQKRIVAILDKAFDGIAKAKTNAEKTSRNARALFESYLNQVFSKRGKDWKIKPISKLVNEGFIAKPQDGNHGEIHPIKADFVEKGIPFIMAADLEDGVVNTRSCRFIKEAQALTLRIGFAKSGDVLLSHKGTIGRAAVLETNLGYVVLTPQLTYYRIELWSIVVYEEFRRRSGFLQYH
jgi:type I restriction enzyme, S subunit